MPLDRPKPPGDYPRIFHNAIRNGVGSWVVFAGTEGEVRREARRFRAFMKSLQDYRLHETSNIADMFEIKTKLIKGTVHWRLAIVVKQKMSELLTPDQK